MTNLIHVHFNSVFESFLRNSHGDTFNAVLDSVADTTSKIIKTYSIINRCPARIDDEVRIRVPSENLLIYAVLNNYVLVFIKHRRF